MNKEIVELIENHENSPLYSEDLAPVPSNKRTWNIWHLASLWVGMAVCIPTYLLASYMIGDGMTWIESLVIIAVANLIITIPMVLNGHAGVKYGIPFPVIGRASFGTKGIHIPSVVRAFVACGWFGIQTWIGGLAIYAIWNALSGSVAVTELSVGKFICFGIFWLINLYFIWKGTESIKKLEQLTAPILIILGLVLIVWGATNAGGFTKVLKRSAQLEKPTAVFVEDNSVKKILINPLADKAGNIKAKEYKLIGSDVNESWRKINSNQINLNSSNINTTSIQFRSGIAGNYIESSIIEIKNELKNDRSLKTKLWKYILWLTIMVGFWATMSLSIADITRYADSQKSQILGQFIGLPGTMILYSFVGIFVTCAATINFDDILISADAPWDPVSLLAKFDNPIVVVISQIFMLIATLSTNIAANVIAPSNAFSNINPKKISFKMGGLITGIIGILICPWLLMNEISGILIFVSGLLGPVLGIMLADYFVIRNKSVELDELFKVNGIYSYSNGFNPAAMIALLLGVIIAIVGYFIPSLEFLYNLSWFSGFFVAFVTYILLMKKSKLTSINLSK